MLQDISHEESSTSNKKPCLLCLLLFADLQGDIMQVWQILKDID